MNIRFVLLSTTLASLMACTQSPAGAGSPRKNTETSTTESEETSVDKPVPVGGTFLTCASEYQDPQISAPTFGCRLESEGARIPVPDTASASIVLYKDGAKVDTTLAKATTSAYWQWLVTTNSKGPFDAELGLGDVIISTASTIPVISAGSGSYGFQKTAVAGSKLVWNTAEQVKMLTVDIDNGDDGLAQTMPTSNYITTFPRQLYVTKAATSVMEIGFYLNDGNIKFCRYIKSNSDPKYFVYSTVNNNCGTAPQNNPTQVTPITEPLNAIVTNIKQAYIQGRTEDNSQVSNGSFTATAILRPFSQQ